MFPDLGIGFNDVISRQRREGADRALAAVADRGAAFSGARSGFSVPRVNQPQPLDSDGNPVAVSRLGGTLDFVLS